MKKVTLFCTLLMALMVSAIAGPVDSTTAKNLATNFWKANISSTRGEQDAPQFRNLAPQMELSHLYIWQNANGEGFVIMSADDCAMPILGFSENGHIDANQMSSNFAYWLQGFNSEIQEAVNHNIVQDDIVSAEWTALARGQVMASKSPTAVNPLLSTTWDQGNPYNTLCPGSSWNRCPTGCVATAMAQVMKYWAYPPKGCGSHSYTCTNYGTLSANFGNTTYSWSSMPNYCTGGNTHVATLMFHCGVATEMEYTTSGSGAQVLDYDMEYPSAEVAFRNFFGYKSTLNGYQKSAFSDNEWKNMLKAELDAGRPVLYSGFGETSEDGGHAFVCDGYNSSNYFHFNWGWSGSNDGYFLLSSLNPGSGGWGGGSYNFTYGQLALFGVEPPALVMNSAFSLTPNSTTVQHGNTLSVSINYKNIRNTAFSGTIRLVLLKEDGNIAQNIGNESSASLASNNIGSWNVSSLITVKPGSYRLAMQYKPTGSNDWILAGIGGGTNLLNVTVVLNPDMYEDNNTVGSAYAFTPNFSNNQATVSTTGSNFHEGDTYDYYKIDLPSGYRYTVNVRLHDGADSGNGQLYTNDAVMKISKNGGSWGATIDATTDAFVLENGGPLVYKVNAKSSENAIGTYLITTQITRTSANGVAENADSEFILYPNPTDGKCMLRNAQPGSELQLFDAFGKLLFARIVSETDSIDLSNFAKGVYVVRITNTQGESRMLKVVKE